MFTLAFLGPSSGDTESTSLIPIIVGAMVGVLAIAAIIVITICCIKKKKSSVKHRDGAVKSAKGIY